MSSCTWCGAYHAAEADARKCEQKIDDGNRRAGCFVAFLLMPFAAVGWILGLAYGAAKDGFREGAGGWPQAWKFIHKKKSAV